MTEFRSYLARLLMISLCALGLAACGMPSEQPESAEAAEAALTGGCNGQSDTSCLGLTVGASCESTGHCRPDPDYHGACDCIVPAPPPPPPTCHCADGSTVGNACHLGGTCHYVLTGQILYCSC
jgi:hypothetical protein